VTAFEIMDYFHAPGGNWIDTAVNYHSGESEQWIGEWMEERGVRDDIVLATKFTGVQITDRVKAGGTAIISNYTGNSAKNIHTSIERSLKQLRTSYIDIVSAHVQLKMMTLTII
jgi:aryl-alcohol dehydrogenase-like predicted oxidoreductase